jgi:hypothetical protein
MNCLCLKLARRRDTVSRELPIMLAISSCVRVRETRVCPGMEFFAGFRSKRKRPAFLQRSSRAQGSGLPDRWRDKCCLASPQLARTVSPCVRRKARKSSRRMKFVCVGSNASAVSSEGLSESVLGKPMISPGSAIRKITALPAAEAPKILTRSFDVAGSFCLGA